MSRKNVAYIRPDEPNFIKALKSKVGYVEPSTVDTKKEIPQRPSAGDDSDDGEIREDEKPTVVVLKKGDITAEEYGELSKRNKTASAGKPAATVNDYAADESGQIKFKKPAKRQSEELNPAPLGASSSKRPKETSQRKETSSKAVRNNNLLSFGDEA